MIEYLLSSPMCMPTWGMLAVRVRSPHRHDTSIHSRVPPRTGLQGYLLGDTPTMPTETQGDKPVCFHRIATCDVRGPPPGDIGAPFGPSVFTHRCPPWRQRCSTPPHYRLLPGCRFGPLIYIPVAPCCSCRGSQGAQGVPADQPRQGQDYFPVA